MLLGLSGVFVENITINVVFRKIKSVDSSFGSICFKRGCRCEIVQPHPVVGTALMNYCICNSPTTCLRGIPECLLYLFRVSNALTSLFKVVFSLRKSLISLFISIKWSVSSSIFSRSIASIRPSA